MKCSIHVVSIIDYIFLGKITRAAGSIILNGQKAN